MHLSVISPLSTYYVYSHPDGQIEILLIIMCLIGELSKVFSINVMYVILPPKLQSMKLV